MKNNNNQENPKDNIRIHKGFFDQYMSVKDKIYKELNKEQDSVNQIDWIELELEALTEAKNLDVEHAEAILRSEFGEKVTQLTILEIFL